MMRIDILTGLPRLLDSPFQESILKRAQAKQLLSLMVHDLRDHTHDKHRTIDDTPYGGGAGMILKPEPIFECIEALKRERSYDEVVLMAADGERFTQGVATHLSLQSNVILICGHYKGVDERVREALVTREISIGDYVLTGGELAAAVVVDAVARLLPGVLNDGESALSDSFQDGLLGSPHYTRPPEYRGLVVPQALLSGDHKRIQEWRDQQRLERTKHRRQDLLNGDHE